MRRLFPVALVLFVFAKSFGQIQVKLLFRDGCENTLRQLEYELVDVNGSGFPVESVNGIALLDAKGTYLLSSSFPKGDKVKTFNMTLAIKDFYPLVDTLAIPRILFTTDSATHSKNWDYFYCDRLCNGDEIDFYPNGEKRLEGSFREGKPIRLSEFRNNGTRDRVIWYRVGFLEYERIEYFDLEGKLSAYATFRKEKKEMIKRIYDSKGTLLNREVVGYNN